LHTSAQKSGRRFDIEGWLRSFGLEQYLAKRTAIFVSSDDALVGYPITDADPGPFTDQTRRKARQYRLPKSSDVLVRTGRPR
jgi:hypothetical protein